ncbi:MAG: class I SAM-dependent methyltransferase [Granulosicoccus sp.]
MSNQQKDYTFEFGKNWAAFLSTIDDNRIQLAKKSLLDTLSLDTLKGRSFLDAGSGSGLFSLSAKQLGATVSSFDYDKDSVNCTRELKKRYFDECTDWNIENGSVLDKDYLQKYITHDIVYSWGVLHHTGDMYQAMENIIPLVAPNGMLLISIYNDQGGQSKRWKKIKKTYNVLPQKLKLPYAALVMFPRECRFYLADLLRGRPFSYFRHVKNYASTSHRGMSYWHDIIDWVGGFPFEVATPEEIFSFYRERGFQLEKLRTVKNGPGCNEFLFRKMSTE